MGLTPQSRREGCFAAQPVGVVAGGDEQNSQLASDRYATVPLISTGPGGLRSAAGR